MGVGLFRSIGWRTRKYAIAVRVWKREQMAKSAAAARRAEKRALAEANK